MSVSLCPCLQLLRPVQYQEPKRDLLREARSGHGGPVTERLLLLRLEPRPGEGVAAVPSFGVAVLFLAPS